MMHVALVSVIVAALPVLAGVGLAQNVGGGQAEPLTPAEWREDLRFLASELVRRHPEPFHTVSPAEFESAVAELDTEIESLPPHRIIIRMAQLATLIGDAHTYVDLPEQGPLSFSRLPIRLTLFSDGLYVSAATEEQRQLVGSRVERIGTRSVDEVLDRVATFVSRDNDMTLRFLVPRRLAIPEVLHAVEVIDQVSRVPLVLTNRNGEPVSLELESLDPGQEVVWLDGAADFGAADALYWAEPGANYWLRHVPDRHALYLQFNSVRDRDDEPLADFARRLGEFISANRINRLIIDVRRNIGGNSRLTYPLIREIIKTGRFEEPGRLFTLTGPASISATVVFAVELDRHTANIFIGEPSGSRPNQYGENRFFNLPNSEVAVSYSSALFQTAGPFDGSEWIAPQVAVSMTSDDYFAGRDPVLEAALEYESVRRCGPRDSIRRSRPTINSSPTPATVIWTANDPCAIWQVNSWKRE
jgi:hypothetical protein